MNDNSLNILAEYNLPDNWSDESTASFDQLSDAVRSINRTMRTSAIKAINRIMTVRNYIIGYYIVEYEQKGCDRANYGEGLLKRLEHSVNEKGLNETLFKIARNFYLNYPQVREYLLNTKSATPSHFFGKNPTNSTEFITPAQEILTKLSFSHIREILTVDDKLARFFYELECIKCCWSVKELRRQIKTNLFFRSGMSQKPELLIQGTEHNAEVQLSIKEPYTFEFLGIKFDALSESDLEKALLANLKDFILELGKGFCFEACQKRMVIDDEYYFCDLVFYNRILHCNVIIELKDDEFKHSDLSQLNAYVSYFRENEMHPGDNPPVGILLCTHKGKKMVEYALAGLDNKLFVSTYMLTLPDAETLEKFIIDELKKA